MRVSLIQVASPDSEDPDARRERVGQMVTSARGSDLIVLPELWAAGYFAFDDYSTRAEPFDGPTVTGAQDWARSLNAHVHLGSFLERSEHGRVHNTAVLIGPTGRVIHAYRKIHVFGYQSREAQLLAPGDSVQVVDDDRLGPITATTCYDLRFPELWRTLVDVGAQTVIVPAAWPAARREHWQLFTSVRAVEEQLLIIACNAVGTQAGTELGGHSRVVDPWGRVLVEADGAEGVFTCDVPTDVVAETRTEFPVLRDRVSSITSAGPDAH